ncbi:hypothetical protein [[Flexibacter] sp. ATCC 35208]|uniref:hypothetical protein n=1 Tax=[Flexibacter] sp. ATCC 35208 TaxID=1936242 RepID=UPI0009CA7803|nr:hypothetical protein [[Flexibacter] sp. ATCC 35208]OMP75486.1 hypothetical protein BW716_29985 [[Flexibacter] sp. ATCC 35208]
MNNNTDKELVDLRLSFSILNKQCFEEFDKMQSLQRDSIIILVRGMQEDLDGYVIDSSSSFATYYNSYRQSFSYMEYIEESIRRMKVELSNIQKDIDSGRTATDYSVFDNAHMYYRCSDFGKSEWFTSPQISFSTEFYSYFFSDYLELLFNHYQYDKQFESANHLPLMGEHTDEFTIPPHIIDVKHARVLLGLLKKKTENVLLKKERDVFADFLQRVIESRSILIIHNYSI